MEVSSTQWLILAGLGLTLSAILILGLYASLQHRRTRKQMMNHDTDIHDRLSRRDSDSIGVLMQLTTVMIQLRKDLVDWWRRQ